MWSYGWKGSGARQSADWRRIRVRCCCAWACDWICERGWWGWEALGHVLVAGHPETVDAQEHLAALVATPAGQCAPADLRLYTLSTPEGPLGLLARLPHQRATADPCSSTAARPILASLRAEIERRQQAGLASGGGEPELALVIDELSSLSGEPDLAYLLIHGRECGLRVLAATADGRRARASGGVVREPDRIWPG